MISLIKKLKEAQVHAFSIRPQVGGFPVLAEVLRQAGLKKNLWSLPSCQSIYLFTEGSIVQQDAPLLSGTFEIPQFNREALISAIRADQEGRSTFPEFLQAAWSAGVTAYEVDFEVRKVSYFGAFGESYVEAYPAVELKKG